MTGADSREAAAEVAKSYAPDWHVAQDAREGTYYCAPAQPDAPVGEVLGRWLAIPIAVVLLLLLRGALRWYRRGTAARNR